MIQTGDIDTMKIVGRVEQDGSDLVIGAKEQISRFDPSEYVIAVIDENQSIWVELSEIEMIHVAHLILDVLSKHRRHR